MKNTLPISQATLFILTWTILWPMTIGCALILLHCVSTSGLDSNAWKQTAEVTLKALPLSLIGALISYVFLHHKVPPLKAKRTFLGIFWAAFWLICLDIMAFASKGTGNASIDGLGQLLVMFVVPFFLGPPITGIAYFASFVPGLCPKNYRGFA
jgi:hypothetical protein